MSKELTMKIPKDLEKIDPNELGEIIWWATHLEVTPEKLLSAIHKNGNSVVAVRGWLKAHYRQLQ